MQCHFEPALASDFEYLLQLRIDAMRDSLEKIGRFDPARARERFMSSFVPEHTQHIVVENERIGFFALSAGENGLMLDHLYIHPKAQKKGIGATVLRHIFSSADQQDLSIRVGALRGSDSNIFYQRHGFIRVEEGEWDIYYERQPGTIN